MYRCNLASVGMRFLKLMITPILWLAFLHTLLICTSKLRPQSLVTPRSFKFLYTFCRYRSHFYSECSSFDIFSGFPVGGSNHTNKSLGRHCPEVSQVQYTVISHSFDDCPRPLIAQNPRFMKYRTKICSTIVTLTRIPEDSHVPYFSTS